MEIMRRPNLSYRDNFLKAVNFDYPEYIPCRIHISWPLWNIYRERLKKLVEQYPLFFRETTTKVEYDQKQGLVYQKRTIVDPFGCVWAFTIKGYQGIVVKHPLADWSKWRDYEFPDPDDGLPVEGGEKLIPWEEVYSSLERMKERGDPVIAYMPHGFFFQRLYYLRGFTNLLKDFLKKPPQIYELIDALTEYNLELVKRVLKFKGIDVVCFGDDLGCQDRMPISPKTFREFIFPAYKKIFRYIRARGIHVRLHTDGHVIEVADQLVEAGVSILNIQDLVNGLENIEKVCKGKVCIDLDIDRQKIVPFGTPKEVKEHIKRAVEVLSMKKGGLMMIADLYPPVPLENIKALCEAFEEYMWLN